MSCELCVEKMRYMKDQGRSGILRSNRRSSAACFRDEETCGCLLHVLLQGLDKLDESRLMSLDS